MLCEICGENEATFHYSEIVNGNKTEHHLCSECAAKTDISYYSSFFENDRLGQFLSGLLGNMPAFNEDKSPNSQIICPACHTSYADFIKNSAFGCEECYNVFSPLLDDSIKKIQGSVTHQGKKPRSLNSAQEDVKNMTEAEEKAENVSKEEDISGRIDIMGKQLKKAVADEDFMEAARLRDEIKELKAQLERKADND